MAPMKVMKGTGKAMTKGTFAKTIAEELELKRPRLDPLLQAGDLLQHVDRLADLAARQPRQDRMT